MLFREVIKLISITYTENAMGDIIEAKTLKEVFANKKPIRSSEFYQAMATGIKPEFMFVIHAIDYANEQSIEYEGTEYKIVRTYDTGEFIELTCEGLVV